ncbi:MAG: hypothetical protein ABI702_00905 [Burkholderiales bacterium]
MHHDRARWLTTLLFGIAMLVPTGSATAQDATALRAREATLRSALASNPFGRPLVLQSTESSGDLKGDVYAIANQPFSVAGPALQGMDHWCDILMLHLNVKGCDWRGTGSASTLGLMVGRKFDQPLGDAHKVDFSYKVVASGADYLQVQLNAEEGPLGTKNYRIVLEATPLDEKSSFIHMSYAYGYGVAARIAMQSYLATLGRDKVGFSIVERKGDGTPVYVGSVLGVIERNAMRYYLAIDSYLAACTLPRAEQPERRIQAWIDSTERYPRQLHEMERDEYLTMKRKELVRQQAAVAKAG